MWLRSYIFTSRRSTSVSVAKRTTPSLPWPPLWIGRTSKLQIRWFRTGWTVRWSFRGGNLAMRQPRAWLQRTTVLTCKRSISDQQVSVHKGFTRSTWANSHWSKWLMHGRDPPTSSTLWLSLCLTIMYCLKNRICFCLFFSHLSLKLYSVERFNKSKASNCVMLTLFLALLVFLLLFFCIQGNKIYF